MDLLDDYDFPARTIIDTVHCSLGVTSLLSGACEGDDHLFGDAAKKKLEDKNSAVFAQIKLTCWSLFSG